MCKTAKEHFPCIYFSIRVVITDILHKEGKVLCSLNSSCDMLIIIIIILIIIEQLIQYGVFELPTRNYFKGFIKTHYISSYCDLI